MSDKLTEIVEGSLTQVAQQSLDDNSLYEITDYPIGGMTNAQMTAALTNSQAGFYQVNSVYMCIDNLGIYLQNHFYKFTGASWVDVTPEFAGEIKEKTLAQLEQETIEDNVLYSVSDYPIGGITQQQMLDALKTEELGFYQVGSVYLCTDAGNDYVQNHFYKFTYDSTQGVYSWYDTHAGADIDDALSDVSTNPVENRVVTNALNNKVSLTGNETIQGTKTFTTRPLVGTTTTSGVALQSEIPEIQANNQSATTEILNKININGVNYLIDYSSGNVSDVYRCIYGTTIYTEITSALGANKLPICIYNDKQYIYYGVGTNSYIFTATYDSINYYITVTNANVWSNGTTALEDANNKVTSISNASTNIEYPSAKCVYDNLVDIREVAEGKTATYVCSDVTNIVLNSQNDTIIITSALTDINNQTINLSDLHIGDNIYVSEIDAPDRWVSNITIENDVVTAITLSKLETAKPPITSISVNSSTIAPVNGNVDISVPTVNDATLTIQKNGTTITTFTANASSNVTANVVVPVDTSDLTNNAGYITNSVDNLTNYTKTSDLSAVATSGSYTDLLNTPTIPDSIQYTTMPTASVDNYRAVVQYIGATGVYTRGYFYECVLDNGIYSWEQKDVQPAGSGGMSNPMTAKDDIIVGGVSGVPTALPKGSNGQVLKIDSGNIVWGNVTSVEEVFVCTYGTTTYSQITSAINDGKLPICLYNSENYVYVGISSSKYIFASTIFNTYNYLEVSTDGIDTTWNNNTTEYEITSNKVTTINNASTDTQYPTAKLLYDQLLLKQNTLSQTQQAAVDSGIDSTKVSQIATNTTDISTINRKIPSQATAENQLADKDFVNSSINALAAFYITRTAAGDNFNTYSQLTNASTFYSGGVARIPTQNDYTYIRWDENKGETAVGYGNFTTTSDYIGYYVIYQNEGVEVDSSNKDNLGITPGTTIAYINLPTTRYSYQGGTYPNGQWDFQLIVNNTPLTASQIAAINSGITSALVTKLQGIESGAQVNTVTSVNTKTGAVVLDADDISDTNTTNKFVTAAEKSQITTNQTAISNIKDGTTIDSFADVETVLSGKQATLVSGTNIKTINSTSILSSGNLALEESGNKVTTISNSSTNTQYPSAKAVYDYVQPQVDAKVGLNGNELINGEKTFTERPKLGQTILPTEFTQVEYIKSVGNQYINLNLVPTSTTKVEIKWLATNYSGTQAIIGCTWNSNAMLLNIQSSKWNLHSNGTVASTPSLTIPEIISYSASANSFTINGAVYNNAADTLANVSSGFKVFGLDSSSRNAYGSLYYLKIYNGQTLVRDFIPCYTNQSITINGTTYAANTIGLYDIVNNIFYTNSGTGDFVKGNDILTGEEFAVISEIPQIEANNQETTTQTLTKLKINGTNYAISGGGGGSTVTMRDWVITVGE